MIEPDGDGLRASVERREDRKHAEKQVGAGVQGELVRSRGNFVR